MHRTLLVDGFAAAQVAMVALSVSLRSFLPQRRDMQVGSSTEGDLLGPERLD